MPEITIQPSGHIFTSQGNETLLEAALRSGLAPNYGCSNGNCGECKARCIDGEVERIRFHDYPLAEADKNAGYFLLCANRALTDVVIETEEAGDITSIPWQRIDTRVKKTLYPGPDIAVLYLQTPRSKRLRFLAGQDVNLTLPAQGGDQSKALSKIIPIASCPCDDRNLQFHVQRDKKDAFSQRIFDQLPLGSSVGIEGPQGNFVLADEINLPLLFFAFETGFAPVKSLIEHALATDFSQPIHLLWLVFEEKGHYMTNLLRSWQDAFDHFYFHPLTLTFSSPRAEGLARVEQMIEVLEEYLPENLSTEEFYTYAAGNEEFIATVEIILQQWQSQDSPRKLQMIA